MYRDLRCTAIRFVELFRTKRLDAELDEEIRFHVAMLRETNLRRGMDPDEAQRAAEKRFGNVAFVKDDYRDGRGFCFLSGFASDVKIAARALRSNLALTFGVGTVLALSVAATILVVSAFNAIVLRPLPYPDSAGIIEIAKGAGGRLRDGHSHSSFEAFRARAKSFSMLAAFESASAGYYADEIGAHVQAMAVSSGYFEVLGVNPVLGRAFLVEEERADAANVVVLSHELWKTKLGANPATLGGMVTLNGMRHLVVGIAAADFRTIPKADAWIPLRIVAGYRANTCSIIGRLQPGVTLMKAQSEAEVVNRELADDINDVPGEQHAVRVLPLHDGLIRGLRQIFAILLVGIAFVHLIACLNTTNLALARLFARARDTAVRMALGAKRGRIVQQYLTEGMMLALLSGLAGLAIARAVLPLLADFSGEAQWNDMSIDGTVLGLAAAVVVASGLISGLLPAVLISRVDPNNAIKEGRWKSVWSYGAARRALVATEVAFCVLLLVSAGLLLRSWGAMRNSESGFDPAQLTTAKLSIRSEDPRERWRESLRALERLRAFPDIEGAAMASSLPAQPGITFPFVAPGRVEAISSAPWRYVTSDYFRVLRIPVLSGRVFDDRDVSASAPVVIVNRQFARTYFGTGDAIGRRLRLGIPPGSSGPRGAFYQRLESDPRFRDGVREIVGIVGDVRERGLARSAPPIVYVPAQQVSEALLRFSTSSFPISWIARINGSKATTAEAFHRDLSATAPELHFNDVSMMEPVLAQSLSPYRSLALVVSAFAAFATIISVSGIYGVISYSVVLRRKELAIGIALGAPARKLLAPVVREGAALGAAGVVLGIIAFLAGRRLLASFVFGISEHDPATLIGAGSAFLLIAVLASLIPALKITRIDAAEVLRCD